MDKKNFYNTKYADTTLTVSPYFKKQFSYLLKNFFSAKKEFSVLDLGGGTGEYALALQELGHNVTLFDFSEEAVKKAQQCGVKETICADFLTYDFSGKKYDVVLLKGFSLLNTDAPDEFEKIMERASLIVAENGMALYWSATDLSGAWTSGGWYNLPKSMLKHAFQTYLLFPAFRYQLNLPLFINRAVSALASLFKLPKPVTLIGIVKC